MKECNTCGDSKHLEFFASYDNGYGVKVRNKCKVCFNTSKQGTRVVQSKKYYDSNVRKIWAKNKEYYQENREVRKEYSREYYNANKKEVRLKVAAGLYGISVEEVSRIRSSPCEVCGCDGTKGGYGIHIDHCHTTGKVRGGLCHYCNIALGLLEDDPNRIDKLKEYLIEHLQQQ